MKVLFIEDHPLKQAQINRFVLEKFPKCEIETKNSYISGLKELIKNHNILSTLLFCPLHPIFTIKSIFIESEDGIQIF